MKTPAVIGVVVLGGLLVLAAAPVAFAGHALSPELRGIGLLKEVTGPTDGIKPMRSLAVTDKEILDHFPFAEVMARLAQQSGERNLTAVALFRRFWATQGSPGNADDTPLRGCHDPLFDYPYTCPRAESALASDDPFVDAPHGSGYVAVGLFSRIDLAATNGADCGEYRIVFARRSGFDSRTERVLINFEAVLPNPKPLLRRRGCLPVARMWRDLSSIEDTRRRAALLRRFYFEGLPGFAPAIHIRHYRGATRHSGQIRTNQFMERPWVLREFRLARVCASDACRLEVIADTVKNAPIVDLFADPPRPDRPTQAEAFQQRFLRLVPELAKGTVADLGYVVPNSFNSGQSLGCNPLPPDEDPCRSREDFVRAVAPSSPFWLAIEKALGPRSPLSAEHILARAQALSCGGCHALSAGKKVGPGEKEVWPASIDFTHVNEHGGPRKDPRDGVLRYGISDALHDHFLPFRATKLAGMLKP
jgi:hypothetical protein